MPEPALIDASCEANGHPTECTEPAPGAVQSDSATGITVTVSGNSKELASIATATMHFNSHAHDHDATNGCHQNETHDIDPDTGEPSITINGSAIYVVDSGVTTDPTTGGDVDITANPISTSITKTP